MLKRFKQKAGAALRRPKVSQDTNSEPKTQDAPLETSTASLQESWSYLAPVVSEGMTAESVPPLQPQNKELSVGPETISEPLKETEPLSSAQDGSDPWASKYVPFAEASVLRSNILSQPSSHYGRVNSSIMQGFGSDDESIWLVDDEETDEEQREGEKSAANEGQTQQGATATVRRPEQALAKPAYTAISNSILAGFDSKGGSDT